MSWTYQSRPIVPFIEGDGIGPDIWRATRRVLDAAVDKAYGGERSIAWHEILAGEKAKRLCDEWLPPETTDAIRTFRGAIKGPLTTPVGGGFRSLNVTLRQVLDLYACVRPVRYFKGVPSPVRHPEKVDMVIFRENTEDVYSGIEWEEGSGGARELIDFLRDKLGKRVREDSGIGIKPISETGSKRLVRKALKYAVAQGRTDVTLVHKGNIMKYTEGAFKEWGYELARDEFGDETLSEQALWDEHDGELPEGKILVKDRIADAMFQQILLRPSEYQVIATTNLNGDYLSDALRRPGRRPGHGARQQRGRRPGAVRGDPRHGAEVRRPGQGQSGLADPVRGDAAALARLGRGGHGDRAGHAADHRREAGDLRPRAADAWRHAAQDIRVRGRRHRQSGLTARGRWAAAPRRNLEQLLP